MKRPISQADQAFIAYCIKELKLTTAPKIRIGDDHRKAQQVRAMGYYNPAENLIWVLRGDRVPADWYRTLAHELVHWRQRELGQEMDGSDGSDLENQANATAGVLLREWGRRYESIYVIEDLADDPNSDITQSLGAELALIGGSDLADEPMVSYSL